MLLGTSFVCLNTYICIFIWAIYVGVELLDIEYVYLFFSFFIFSLFIFGCIGSLLLCTGFRQLGRAGATLRCGVQASHCNGFSRCRAQALGVWASVAVARGLSSTGSVVVVHRLSCSTACGIFPDQGSNPCPLHRQAGS